MFFIPAPTKAEVRDLYLSTQSKLSDVTLTEGADQDVLTWHVANTQYNSTDLWTASTCTPAESSKPGKSASSRWRISLN